MSDASKCDRCGEYFTAAQRHRKFQLRMDVLRSSTTPTIRHKARDLCPDCYEELKEWYEQ